MNTLKRNLKRLTALLLCAVMMLGALPLQLDLSPKASGSWALWPATAPAWPKTGPSPGRR